MKQTLSTKKTHNIDLPTPKLLQDLGRLLVGNRVKHMAEFLCPYCGSQFTTDTYSVLSGHTKSCGCYNKLINHNEQYLWHAQGKESPSITHGQSNTKLYRRWRAMINRVNDPNVERYVNYGGRGISICEEWYNFETFYKWAQNSGYDENLILDRINVDGNYCPENCRWVDASISACNKQHRDMYGIYKTNYRKWVVYFRRKEGDVYLGVFETIEEAKVERNKFLEYEKNNEEGHS